MSYIELSRQFREIKKPQTSEEAATLSYVLASEGSDLLSWLDLLHCQRAIVLGEAGSGKTAEFTHYSQFLAAREPFVFFIPIDQLAVRDLAAQLQDEYEKFRDWKEGEGHAFFFLDSVDESKFRSVTDYYAAMERFANAIGIEAKARTSIYVSSRISEWRPERDGDHFLRLFPPAPTSSVGDVKNPNRDFITVQIEPLDRSRAMVLAEHKGVVNIDLFAVEIAKAYAWEFTRRPVDVLALIQYWLDKGRIGTMTELIEFDITTKLKSRESDRHDLALSEEDGRIGVECLAVANLFSRLFSFRIDDEVVDNYRALTPSEWLPKDWDGGKVRALLNRPIFDSAFHGHIRFHHRRIAEYLAAQWVLKQECSPDILLELFVDVTATRKVLRPSLRPVAAWICCSSGPSSEDMRDLVLRIEPGILLAYGDPSRLTQTYRLQVLRALALLSEDRKRIWLESSPECIARIADDDLTSDITGFLTDQSLAVNFREAVVQIVQRGHLVGCCEAVLSIVADPNESESLKIGCIHAIAAMNDAALCTRLYRVLLSLPEIPLQLMINIIERLYPHTLSSLQLIELLRNSENSTATTLGLPVVTMRRLMDDLSEGEATAVLQSILQLAPTPSFSWIGRLIPSIVGVLLRKEALDEHEAELAAEALLHLDRLTYLRQFGMLNEEELNAGIHQHANVRECYLWMYVDKARLLVNGEPHMYLLCDGRKIVRLGHKDFDWLLESATTRPSHNDRVIAINLAIYIWNASGRDDRRRRLILKLAHGDGLCNEAVRNSPLLRHSFPVKGLVHRLYSRDGDNLLNRWSQVMKVDVRSYALSLGILMRIPLSHAHRDWLFDRCMEISPRLHYAVSDWSFLSKSRGHVVTRAVRYGCKKSWRNFTPPLRHQSTPTNKLISEVIVGLTGLQVELGEDECSVNKLTSREAYLAALYAINEVNGFPSWLECLGSTHPDSVGRALDECVEGEWLIPHQAQHFRGILADIQNFPKRLRHFVERPLLAFIHDRDPLHDYVLLYATSILMRSSNPPLQELLSLARERSGPRDMRYKEALWTAVLMHLDATLGMKNLNRLASESEEQSLYCVFSILSNSYATDIGPFSTTPDYLRSDVLLELIPLVYQWVPPESDRVLNGESYDPNLRDDAKEFRERLLYQLDDGEGQEVTNVMRELVSHPFLVTSRERLQRTLEKRVLDEANAPPWFPEDFRAFEQDHESTPQNLKHLFMVVTRRMLEIRRGVEQSDNSTREQLRTGDQEIFLRKWLHRKLTEHSRGKYTVAQEDELDGKFRPDLRIHSAVGFIPIEVKWADDRSISALVDGLESQLVGRYLRDHDSRYAFYFLGVIKQRKSWKHPSTGKSMCFEDVLAYLRQEVDQILLSSPGVDGIEIVGMDFRHPV